MHTPNERSRAFTLIELLIVVAIIAILALIAVPNFLEAQTRAKCSRVKNDLRTIAVAEEAYRVDWNSYTHYNPGSDCPWLSGRWAGFAELTTPVAYVTSIPRDPFGISRYGTSAGSLHHAVYEMGCGAAGIGPAGRQWDQGPGMPSDVFMLESDGPDHDDDTNGNLSTGNFPWATTIQPNNPGTVAEALAMIYDPTNGTVSSGEIFKMGGQKPGGTVFDVVWAGGQ